MADHPLKESYPALKPAQESTMNSMGTLTAIISKILGVYTGECRFIPMIRGDNEACYRLSVNKNSIPENWMDKIEAYFKNNSSWRLSPSSPIINIPVIRYQEREAICFVYKDYAIEIFSTENDQESTCCYEGFGQVGRVIAEIARKMGVHLTRNGWGVKAQDEGIEVGEVKGSTSLYDFFYHAGLMSSRYSNPYYHISTGIIQIVSSKYFSQQVFDEEARARLADCHFFQKMVNDRVFTEASNRHDYDTDRAPWVTWMKKNYPSLTLEVQSLIRNNRRTRYVSLKYNDDLIKEVIGSDRANEVNSFKESMMSAFKTLDDFEEFVLTSAPDTIRSKMTEVHSGNFTRKTPVSYGPENSFGRHLPKEETDFDPQKTYEYRGFKYKILGGSSSKNYDGKIERVTMSVLFVETPPGYADVLTGATRTFVSLGHEAFYKQ